MIGTALPKHSVPNLQAVLSMDGFCFGALMISGQTIIYEGRLEVSRDALIKFLDYELEKADSLDQLLGVGYAPFPLLPIERFNQKYGEKAATPREIEEIINPIIGEPDSGRIYIQRYWHENIQIMLGWNYVIGFAGFYVGRIELDQPKLTKHQYTDVVIVNNWPAMRPYYEWVTKRLRMRFKERRKGGPKATPIAKRLEIVLGWKKVEGKQLKEIYCSNNSISISTLRNWERELKEKGYLPKG